MKNNPNSNITNPSVIFNGVVRMRQLTTIVGLARSTIYQYIKEGRFPKPFKIGEKAVAWRLSTVESWIEQRENSN